MSSVISELHSIEHAGLTAAKRVIMDEMVAIESLLLQINQDFARACDLLLNCPGKVIVTGMGKSGHIASKIAATFASTGTPAFFLHPAEALHGDLGMISTGDVLLAISYSGETEEILCLLPHIRNMSVPIISITGNSQSRLAAASQVSLLIDIAKEACPLNLAPTSSTTATLVLGDALAVALFTEKEFTAKDFARSHPSGRLGKRLILRVNDLMATGPHIPHVLPHTLVTEALVEMSSKRLGMTAVCDAENHVLGLFTDGDLRRSIDKGFDLQRTTISEVMTPTPKTIASAALAIEALEIMQKSKINALLVVQDTHLVGVITLHHLLAAGLL